MARGAELALRAFLDERVVMATVTATRKIDFALENPAWILEEVSDVARDGPGLVGLCSQGETPSLTAEANNRHPAGSWGNLRIALVHRSA